MVFSHPAATVAGVQQVRAPRITRLATVAVAAVLVASCSEPSGPANAPSPSASAQSDDAEPSAPATVVVTPTGESWFDPEVLIHDGRGWMSWQDASGGVWLVELDLHDGLPVPAKPVLVASDGAAMLDTFNGPELGVDAEGVSLWYTASTPDGLRVMRAGVGGPAVTVEAVTSAGYFSPLPSRRDDHATTQVVAVRRPPGFGTAVWFDEATPTETVDLVWIAERGGGDARWVAGTGLITVAGALDSGAAVEVVDTATGATTEVATADDGAVENPYGWIDPLTERLSVLAVVGGDELVVWDIDDDGAAVERAAVSSPVDDHPWLGSPEPFLVHGRAWATITIADRPTTIPGSTHQQVWLVPLDGGEPQRCDDGATTTTTRVDPEVLVSGDEVFVYYYAWNGTRSEVHRCAVSATTLEG